MAIVIYPIFEECKGYVLDAFWKDVFGQCAMNRFPKGIRYVVNSIASSSTDPGFEHKFSIKTIKKPGSRGGVELINLPTEPKVLVGCLLSIFREKLDMYSSLDLQIKKEEFEEMNSSMKVNYDCTWKELKPKNVKDSMIRNYIIELQQRHSLTDGQARKLLSEINCCVQLKILDHESINYANGKIHSIKGIESKPGQPLKVNIFENANIQQKVSKIEKSTRVSKLQQSVDKFSKGFISRHNTVSEIL